jgi:23S rRNA (adenine2030-N6)-methyltransferase
MRNSRHRAMNYRHAFHAGNFADVFKHVVLSRIVAHLRAKPTAFRAIDTHAGAGLYDLTGEEANRTGEFHNGIERLIHAPLDANARQLLSLYLDAIAAHNPPGRLSVYPGSPALLHAWLRPQDGLIACELEPKGAAALSKALRGDPRAKAVTIDGWIALSACVPPKERRGVVIVDPPYEQPNEFIRLCDSVQAAHRKWPTGIYLLWYPIKDRCEPDALATRLARSGIAKIARAELDLAPTKGDPGLRGCGLVVVNPPWTLERELAVLLPVLASVLSLDGNGKWRFDWLASEIMPQ